MISESRSSEGSPLKLPETHPDVSPGGTRAPFLVHVCEALRQSGRWEFLTSRFAERANTIDVPHQTQSVTFWKQEEALQPQLKGRLSLSAIPRGDVNGSIRAKEAGVPHSRQGSETRPDSVTARSVEPWARGDIHRSRVRTLCRSYC